jgi:alginate O-acetyltransferase complex protein AlgI
MLFPTVTFAAFFAVVFVGSWLLRPNRGLWKLFLLVASYVFYGWWEPWFCLVLFGLTLATQVLATGVFKSRGTPAERTWLVLAIGLPVVLLVLFKYGPLHDVMTIGSGDRVVEVLVPVGISFLVFQSVLLVFDVHRGLARPPKLVDTALFLAFFPRLLAGPILRAGEFVPQLHHRGDPRFVDAAPALRLISLGLIKAVVISNFIATELVDPVFANPGAHAAPEVLLAIVGFTAQFYCDVSGYADLVVAFALLLGLRIPDNVRAPLVAPTLREFWRRWQVTLHVFFREAVYVPLGGDRTGGAGTLANVFLVFVVASFWYGAKSNFIAWGLVCGAVAVAERALLGPSIDKPMKPARRVVGWLVTLAITSLTFVLFRSESVAQARDVLARLAHWSGGGDLVTPLLVVVIVAVIVLQAVPPTVISGIDTAVSRLPALVQAVTLAAVLYVVYRLGPDHPVPFTYMRF